MVVEVVEDDVVEVSVEEAFNENKNQLFDVGYIAHKNK
jgi:hypothetical protein